MKFLLDQGANFVTKKLRDLLLDIFSDANFAFCFPETLKDFLKSFKFIDPENFREFIDAETVLASLDISIGKNLSGMRRDEKISTIRNCLNTLQYLEDDTIIDEFLSLVTQESIHVRLFPRKFSIS